MTEPFLLYSLPGEDIVHRLSCDGLSDDGAIIFGKAKVEPWMFSQYRKEVSVDEKGTEKEDYIQSVGQLIPILAERHGKTVIQRTIAGAFSNFEPRKMAEDYFNLFPDMFCFLFYHPRSSWWMGATPELLLTTEGDGVYLTRALAGTRTKRLENEPWSEKNIEEHQFVVNDISADIFKADPSADIRLEPRLNFSYAEIEHLCTPIRIQANPDIFERLKSAIHPTAAVCGMPRDIAVNEISQFERSPRKYYAGTITVPGHGPKSQTSYVILRCVHFDERRWCIYTGSGITESSIPEDEWNETEHKAAPLLKLLSRH